MKSVKPEEVVNAYFEAFAARDFDRVRTYLADDAFTYVSPIEAVENADAFVINISRIGPILERVERCKTFVDGNDVCSVMKIYTTMDVIRAVTVMQVATVIDGKITAIESVFDATEYNKMIVPSEEQQ